ncbi:transposase [Burkholderia ubonensis]|uniref:transposase n=1 Tax=Burkholderia ubonensis TaxID=101571 RepID=UPI0012FCF595|nr:transposase [Burkholderia ubonensis]
MACSPQATAARPRSCWTTPAFITASTPRLAIDGRWPMDHRALLFYLPAYSPELNTIEIVWRQLKYRWRNFVTRTKETIDAELAELLRGYGSAFQANFS